MPVHGTLLQGKYLDSVKLMLISKEIRKQQGVQDAVAIMATSENKAILKATGMLLPEFEAATDNTICIAVNADSEKLCIQMMELAQQWIEKGLPGMAKSSSEFQPRSIGSAVQHLEGANLALISVAGKYAGVEAKKALDLGLNVMLFSDNISIKTELQLKEYAISKNLLMMGPDCGTAIIKSIPLAFANAVRKGKIGIVSAAGTGLQEVSSIIHNSGEGISQAFGTGGRDGKKEIGGLMLLFCLQYLIKDPVTEVIVLISKVPDPEVVTKLWELLKSTAKPVVYHFLKPFTKPDMQHIYAAESLADAASKACRLIKDNDLSNATASNGDTLFNNRALVTLPKSDSRIFLRGLYSGGTLCYETQNIYHQNLKTYPYSNAPLHRDFLLADAWQSKEDTIIDLGSDEFTVGRPHPMIDYSLRLKKLADESRDDSVAVILFDVVLGYGSHPQPHLELSDTLNDIKKRTDIVLICNIVGTDDDLQNRKQVIKSLQEAGVIVTTTNAEAAALAVRIIQSIRRK